MWELIAFIGFFIILIDHSKMIDRANEKIIEQSLAILRLSSRLSELELKNLDR